MTGPCINVWMNLWVKAKLHGADFWTGRLATIGQIRVMGSWPDSVIKKMTGAEENRPDWQISVAVLQIFFFFDKVNCIFTRHYNNRLAQKHWFPWNSIFNFENQMIWIDLIWLQLWKAIERRKFHKIKKRLGLFCTILATICHRKGFEKHFLD